jgi:formylmethanofuran dehydrogenase subunit B
VFSLACEFGVIVLSQNKLDEIVMIKCDVLQVIPYMIKMELQYVLIICLDSYHLLSYQLSLCYKD